MSAIHPCVASAHSRSKTYHDRDDCVVYQAIAVSERTGKKRIRDLTEKSIKSRGLRRCSHCFAKEAKEAQRLKL